MKRKYIFIIIAVLIIILIASFSMIGCKKVASETTATATSIAQTTGVTTVETMSTTSVETTAVTTSATETETTSPQEQQQIIYTNTQYGFSFTLSLSWKGYKIIENTWEANPQEGVIAEQGPLISIRNPKWTSENPYQDIPIMIFTLAQWDLLQQDKFHIGAAPIGPSELGSNIKYVFALPARYNYVFPTGWQEVENFLEGNPLKAF